MFDQQWLRLFRCVQNDMFWPVFYGMPGGLFYFYSDLNYRI